MKKGNAERSRILAALVSMALVMGLSSAAFAQDETVNTDGDEVKHGGLFLEPSLTYQWGDTTVSYPAPLDDSKEEVRGVGLGMRLGFHAFESVFVAVDGRYARPEYDSSALGGKGQANAYNAGVTLGLQTPLAGMRVWGTYIFDGTLDPEKIEDVDVKFNAMRGYRVGVGFYVSTVSINLEYQDAQFDSTTVEDAGPITGANYNDIEGKDKSYILSLSFPIAL